MKEKEREKPGQIVHLVRPELREFMPYRSARDEAKVGKIWLNANESPFSSNFQEGQKSNRYPEKQPHILRERLAGLYEIDASQLAICRGSDEAIDLLVRLFCRAEKDAALICSPTFGMYAVCAKLQGAKVVEVPLNREKGHALHVPLLIDAWRPSVKIIFLCSPNNPTGNLLNGSDVLHICKHFTNQSIIVVDEAYIEYASAKSLSGCIGQYPNLVILRTFSKAYGMAAIRCGCLIANQEVVDWILKIIAPYPVSSLVSQAVLERTSPQALRTIRQQIESVVLERERLFDVLKSLPVVKHVWPSQANFLLIEVDCPTQVLHHCAERGIVVRNMQAQKGLTNCLRISVGTPEENDCFIHMMKNIVPFPTCE